MAKIVANWVNQKKQWLVQIKDDGTLKARRLELDEPIESGISYITAGLGLLGGTITSGGTISVNFGTTVNQVARGNHFHNAVSIPILDSGNYYSAANVEDALQEVGSALNNVEIDIVEFKERYSQTERWGVPRGNTILSVKRIAHVDKAPWVTDHPTVMYLDDQNAHRDGSFEVSSIVIADAKNFSILETGILGPYKAYNEEVPPELATRPVMKITYDYHQHVGPYDYIAIGDMILNGNTSPRIMSLNRAPFPDVRVMTETGTWGSNIYRFSLPLSKMPTKSLMNSKNPDWDAAIYNENWWDDWVYVDALDSTGNHIIEGYDRWSWGPVTDGIWYILERKYVTLPFPSDIIDFEFGKPPYIYVLISPGNQVYRVERTDWDDPFRSYGNSNPQIKTPEHFFTSTESINYQHITGDAEFIYLQGSDPSNSVIYLEKIRISDGQSVASATHTITNDDGFQSFDNVVDFVIYKNRLLVNAEYVICVFDADSFALIKNIRYTAGNLNAPGSGSYYWQFGGLVVSPDGDGVTTFGHFYDSSGGTHRSRFAFVKLDFTQNKASKKSNLQLIDAGSVVIPTFNFITGELKNNNFWNGMTLQRLLNEHLEPIVKVVYKDTPNLEYRLKGMHRIDSTKGDFTHKFPSWPNYQWTVVRGSSSTLSSVNNFLHCNGSTSFQVAARKFYQWMLPSTQEGYAYYIKYDYSIISTGHATSGIKVRLMSAEDTTTMDITSVGTGTFSKILISQTPVLIGTIPSGNIFGDTIEVIYNRNTQARIGNIMVIGIQNYGFNPIDGLVPEEAKQKLDVFFEEEIYPQWRTNDDLSSATKSYEQFYLDYFATRNKAAAIEATVSNIVTTVNNVVQDKHYVHNQQVSQTVWTINHNLNKIPSILTIDSFDFEMIGDIQVIDNNNITITFTVPVFGKAYLN